MTNSDSALPFHPLNWAFLRGARVAFLRAITAGISSDERNEKNHGIHEYGMKTRDVTYLSFKTDTELNFLGFS